jgi:hypothetical protein
MKNLISLTLVILTTLILFLPSVNVASDMSIGAATWYAWWEDDDGDEYDPALMYGPALSLGLADSWSLTGVMLYGRFENVDRGTKFDRYDSDLALNYGLNRYLKIFAGAKYLYVDVDEGDGSHKVISPAAGIGISIPLGQSVYLLCNASALYGWGKEKGFLPTGDRFSSDLNEKSLNSTLSIAWYIDSMSTTLSLGGRYQRGWATYDNELIDDSINTFYGITFGAVYSFGL